MKILAIRGCNLASIEGEFNIDFTCEPLKSAGIFAITGNTGSGKSTLLDALCLALFNKTPRANQLERDKTLDVTNQEISVSDPRQILRRGTGNGYAEVEFIALNGDTYYSRWNVRRSRDKAMGALQPWELSLQNITTGEEVQGDKTELLKKITELIGLTYDQFTRAVLLAQGDFATFLKADRKEKAELLEKLTGTNIYSRISKSIYEKSKQATASASEMERDILNIALLSEEEVAEKMAALSQTKAELESHQQKVDLENKKLEWLKIDLQHLQKINEAKMWLDQSAATISEAQPRFDFLKKIESVQEIRDEFISLQNIKAQKSNNEMQLQNQDLLLKNNQENIDAAASKQTECEHKKSDLAQRWEVAQVNLQRARTLETQIESTIQNYHTIQQEYNAIKTQHTDLTNQKNTQTQTITQLENSQKELEDWFLKFQIYETIVPKIALINQNITDAIAIKQKNNNTLEKIKTLTTEIQSQETSFLKLKEEETQLSQTLSSEIIILRKKLVDGEPCPVCGSTEHAYEKIEGSTLNDEVLTQAKEKVAQKIAQLETLLRGNRESLAGQNSLLETNEKQFHTLYDNITTHLQGIDNWQPIFEQGTLATRLSNFEKNWGQKTETFNQQKQDILLASQALGQILQQLSAQSLSLEDKGKQFEQVQTSLESLQVDRKQIFNGGSVESVENKHQNEIKKTDEALANANKSLNELQGNRKEIEGVISQLKSDLATFETALQRAQQTLDNWIQGRAEPLTMEELSQLLNKDSQWINTERGELEKLKNQKITIESTFKERISSREEHQKSDIKAVEEETETILNEQISVSKKQINVLAETQTNLTAQLNQNVDAHAKVADLKKKFEKRAAHAKDWAQLSDLLGSSDGAKFRNIAQAYTLDALLAYANTHLKEISSRYILTRTSPEALSLQVIDLDMMSEKRSVHSLSGGESFLVSLALALGLSSLSSNQMQIESLFIDEGFGTLDAETLRTAMEVLGSLQSQGRKIGVISHVTEMMEDITTKIKVEKVGNGRSRVCIS